VPGLIRLFGLDACLPRCTCLLVADATGLIFLCAYFAFRSKSKAPPTNAAPLSAFFKSYSSSRLACVYIIGLTFYSSFLSNAWCEYHAYVNVIRHGPVSEELIYVTIPFLKLRYAYVPEL